MNEWLADRRNLSRRHDPVKINLALDYVVREEYKWLNVQDGVPFKDDKGNKVPSFLAESRRITAALIENAFVARYGPEGCKDKTVKKLNARIWRSVEKAIVDGRDSVDLERGQVEHVLETLEAWDMKGDVGKVGFWGDLVSHLESALREPEAESLSGANGAVEKPRKVKV